MIRCWALAALFSALLFLTSASPAGARTWYVKPDSTGDVPTISVAVDSAAALGDTVLLADGTFTGAGNRMVDCLDKALVITSKSGNPEETIIDCGVAPCLTTVAAFFFRSTEPGAQRLEAVTITRGCGGVVCDDGSRAEIVDCIFRDNSCPACEVGAKGAGVLVMHGSSPTIIDCLFQDNDADGGGGLASFDSSPVLINVVFLENFGSGGGGMIVDGGSATLTGCSFMRNLAWDPFGSRFGGGGLVCSGQTELVDCMFEDNCCWDYPGGGLYFLPNTPSDRLVMTGCTFAGNRLEEPYGGGSAMAAGYMWSSDEGSVEITNCTFVGNTNAGYNEAAALSTIGDFDVVIENTIIAYTDSGPAISCIRGGTLTVRCSDFFGNDGGDWTACVAGQLGVSGNISADPLFCDTLSGDYRLETCSPCLPGNHPDGYDCGVPIGAFCSGCACGEATEATTWGAIKAMYR
jgi:hypothetical protein